MLLTFFFHTLELHRIEADVDPRVVTARLEGVSSSSGDCLNCGSALRGRFCAGCGQRAIVPYPTVRELAEDVALAVTMFWAALV